MGESPRRNGDRWIDGLFWVGLGLLIVSSIGQAIRVHQLEKALTAPITVVCPNSLESENGRK